MPFTRRKVNKIFDRLFTDVSERTLSSEEHNIGAGSIVNDWPSRVAAFCGLPINPYFAPLSWGRFFRKMTAWHYYDSPEGQKWLNWTIVKPLVFFALNLFAIPFKFALNILKLVTAFLPLLVAAGLEHIYEKLADSFDKHSDASLGRKIFSGVVMVPVLLAFIPFSLVGNFAHSLTSPVNAVTRLSEEHPILAGMLGGVIAVAYMALTPLAVYILGPIILAKAATILPAALTHVIQAAVSAVAAIGHAIAPVCQFIGTYLSVMPYVFGLTTMQVGLGQLIGLAALTLGTIYVVSSEKIARWYNSFRETEHLGFENVDRPFLDDSSFEPTNKKLNQSFKANHTKHHEEYSHRNEGVSIKSSWKSFWSSLAGSKNKDHGYVSDVNEVTANRKKF